MVDRRSKGRRAELEAKRLLEVSGWRVVIVDPPKRYKKDNDFLNLFDIIAFRGFYKKFVQVKCNRKPTLKKYREWAETHCNMYDSVEVWIRKDYENYTTRWWVINVSEEV